MYGLDYACRNSPSLASGSIDVIRRLTHQAEWDRTNLAPSGAVTTASAGAYAKHESELVPAAIVVGLIDAHAFREQANQEREWGDHPVPKATPKTRRFCIRLFVLGI
jgi:hypothetical protein